jgi:hypothetical protein
VSTVTNTIVSIDRHADLGMPMFRRDRLALLCALPTTGVVSPAAGRTWAFGAESSVTSNVVVTDAPVTAGAFPGTSAWSPPI